MRPDRPALTAPRSAFLILCAALACSASTHAATVPTGFVDLPAVGVGSRAALDRPVAMAFLPDGRLLVAEQKRARLRLFVGSTLASVDPVATLPGVRTTGGEQGLLGIAVDPAWPARPYVYVHCDDASGPFIRISRYTTGGDLAMAGDGSLTVDPATRYDVLTGLPDAASNHNGGTLRFGPDGMLYASLGDDMDHCGAQDPTVLVGKILRLDVSRLPDGPGGPPPVALLTLADNPFVALPDSNAHLVWALGLRNPFRFCLDPAWGSLYVGDVGEGAWEEIDQVLMGGRNFGWPLYEGPALFDYPCPDPLSQGEAPIHAYSRAGVTASVVAGCVYRAPDGAVRPLPPSYEGDLFFSDYYQGFLRRLKRSHAAWALADPEPGQPSPTAWGQGFEQVSDWQVSPDGTLWYCRQSTLYVANTGQIRRIALLPSDAVPPPSPAAFELAPPRPTPAVGRATLHYTLAAASRVDLEVFDMAGRRVRLLAPSRLQGAGAYDVTWDGADDDGRAVGPAVYVVRLRVDERSMQRRLPLLR